MTAQQVLKKYFGYDNFRNGQEEVISAALEGRDVLGIMPTGAGKSLCYQVPGLIMNSITIVVSPLISLMQDQVTALNKSGISATFINSSRNMNEIRYDLELALNGEYKFIYVAPERLLNPEFLQFAKVADISMVTIDEAHCISHWGQDFRPSYMQIPTFIDELPKRPVVTAYTATATTRVKEDIVANLKLQQPKVLITGFNRENLYFGVETPKDKILALVDFLAENKDKFGVIYCLTRKAVEKVCDELNSRGFSAGKYHAGLSDNIRKSNQDDFLFDKIQVMVATNAFGMGIDKSNISFVIHYNMPKDIESYYQEAGRAGRDGSQAKCILYYSKQDVRTIQWMIDNGRENTSDDEKTVQELKEGEYRRLRDMTFYSTTHQCLRGHILRYFGENPTQMCGYCSNCQTKFEVEDITIEAQKILSCVYRAGERFGGNLIIDILRGSQSKKITEQGLDKLSTYNISEKSSEELKTILDYLLRENYVSIEDSQFSILKLTKKAWDFFKSKEKIIIHLPKERVVTEKSANSKDDVPFELLPLFEDLKALRKAVAREEGVPTFVIFTDKTLADMCVKMPQNLVEFRKVSGVGEAKLRSYGEIFVKKIVEYCVKNGIEVKISTEVETKKVRKNPRTNTPNEEIIGKFIPSEEPLPVSILTKNINVILEENDCPKVTSMKMNLWFIKQGYLYVDKNEEIQKKLPTEKGLATGIITEKRVRDNNTFLINLFPKHLQKEVMEHVLEIYKMDKNAT